MTDHEAGNMLFTLLGLALVASLLIGWRRDRRQKRTEEMLFRALDRFDHSWVPKRDRERWESCN